jgi:hypothetical protein
VDTPKGQHTDLAMKAPIILKAGKSHTQTQTLTFLGEEAELNLDNLL